MNDLESENLSKKERRLFRRQEEEQEQTQKTKRKKIKKLALILGFMFLVVGAVVSSIFLIPKNWSQDSGIKITIFKSPTCGCCAEYITYLKSKNFQVEVVNTQDMLSIKEKYNIPQDLESCHTGIVGNYFLEGHIPIEAIQKLLEEKPDILGIALPGMPSDAPGMGGVKSGEFKIYGLLKDGSAFEFMSI